VGAVRALNPATGQVAWEYRLFSPLGLDCFRRLGIWCLGHDEGQAFALQASTGKLLLAIQAGGVAHSNPMTYLSDGKQAGGVGWECFVLFGLE